MSFLTKLLAPKEAVPMISLAEHEAVLAKQKRECDAANGRLNRDLRAARLRGDNWRESAFKSAVKVEELEAGLATARAEADANKADAEELARWRQWGQMRDPKTGRLIPKGSVAA